MCLGQTVKVIEQKQFQYVVFVLPFWKSSFQISITSSSANIMVTEKTKTSLERKFCALQTLYW